MQPNSPRRPRSRADIVRVLIVTTNAGLGAALQAGLQHAGLVVDLAAGADEIAGRATAFAPDVIVVDAGMPEIGSRAIVARFAANAQCSTVMIAADDTPVDAAVAGVDAVLNRTATPRSLAARIRRLHAQRQRPQTTDPMAITIDRAKRHLLSPAGDHTPLSDAEYETLAALLDAQGSSVSREWLGRIALKRVLQAGDRSIDQVVLELRRKLGRHGAATGTILSARGQGYVIADPAAFRIADGE